MQKLNTWIVAYRKNSPVSVKYKSSPRLWNDIPPGLRRLGLTFESFRKLIYLATEALSDFYRCYTNKSIYLSTKKDARKRKLVPCFCVRVYVDMSGGVGGGCRKLELPGHHYKHSAKSPGKSGRPRSPRAHHGGRKTSTERRHRGRSRDNTEEDTEVVFKKESTSQSSPRHRTTVAQKRRGTTTPSYEVRCRVLRR